MARVANPTPGPARSLTPAGTSVNRSIAIGIARTAMIMNATPETTGVIRRRICASRAAIANCTSDEAITRLDIIAKPPCSTASTQAARNGTPDPIRSVWPGPKRPILDACRAVARPATIRAPTMAQVT